MECKKCNTITKKDGSKPIENNKMRTWEICPNCKSIFEVTTNKNEIEKIEEVSINPTKCLDCEVYTKNWQVHFGCIGRGNNELFGCVNFRIKIQKRRRDKNV